MNYWRDLAYKALEKPINSGIDVVLLLEVLPLARRVIKLETSNYALGTHCFSRHFH
jgi:hypothetical protein